MRIAFIGDIVGDPGRRVLKDTVHQLEESLGFDFLIANAENAAAGKGITPRIVEEIFACGPHVLTGGNHTWDKPEGISLLDNLPNVLRPYNYPKISHGAWKTPGKGVYIDPVMSIAVINLQGRSSMEPIDCPFQAADDILSRPEVQACRYKIVDFHAETTSEKCALGWYLDGRVTAVLGTHTHVPTSDTRLLPKGTGFQCDVGMTGATDSILGVEVEIILKRFLTKRPVRHELAQGRPRLRGVWIEADRGTGLCQRIERLEYSP